MYLALNLPISFDEPVWLLLLLLIPVLAAVSARTLAGLDRPRRITAIVLRSLVIAALAVALARVQFVKRNDHVAVMFVLDRSKSIPDDLRLKAQEYIKNTVKQARKQDDQAKFGMIGFDGQADVTVVPSRVGAEILDFGMAAQPDRTNIAGAVRMALAAFPEGYARRMVIMTDGNQNVGDLTHEIEAAVASGVAVDVVPLEFQHKNEILFDRISVPSTVPRDTRVPVRMIVKSTHETKARLTLYHNDREVPLREEDRIVQLSGGMMPERLDVPIPLTSGGVHRFDARLAPLDPNDDSVTENNRATAFTFVQDQGRVLILTPPGVQDDTVLCNALKREKIDVEMRGTDYYRNAIDLLALQEFSVVILSNVPADEFNDTQHKALASYVRDFGGGLIMTGGDNGFGAGGWIGKPLEEVSPVAFEIKQDKKMPRGALVIIMHSCEIAKGNYWAQQVAIATVNTISSMDYLGILSYSYNPGGVNWDVPLKPATNKAAIIKAISQMKNGDMPDFDTTMNMAVEGLLKLPDASQKHMIIISDGDPQPPGDEVIRSMVKNKITCSTVAIGYGAHVVEKTLRDIAIKTHPGQDGSKHFYPCRNPNQLPQIFVKEAKIVRRSLIQDQPFQPLVAMPFDQTITGLGGTQLPPLGGLVLTTQKPESLMPLARKSDKGTDPVLAYWNYEMGKMAVFTSGYWPKWGADWSRWESFGKFWAQLIRWATRQAGTASFEIIPRLEGNRGKISIEAINKDASYLNNLRFPRAKMMTPSGEIKDLFLTQVGPGQYESSFDVNDNGSYLASLTYIDPNNNNEQGIVTTGLSVPYSPEFRELNTNMPLLQSVVQKASGRMLAMDLDKDDVFDKNLPPSVSRQPVWRWVVQWLLLPLFLLDVAARRLASALAMSIYAEVAVFVTLCATLYAGRAPFWAYLLALLLAEAIGWAIRWRFILPTIEYFTHSVTVLARAGQRSTQSLSQLKGVREKVRESLQTPDSGDRKSPATSGGRRGGAGRREAGTADQTRDRGAAIPLEPAADPKARFDVGDKAAAQPAGDLTETVGGAKAETPADRARQGQGPQDDLTSRLLKAKQRAREEMKDRKNPEG